MAKLSSKRFTIQSLSSAINQAANLCGLYVQQSKPETALDKASSKTTLTVTLSNKIADEELEGCLPPCTLIREFNHHLSTILIGEFNFTPMFNKTFDRYNRLLDLESDDLRSMIQIFPISSKLPSVTVSLFQY